MKKGNPILTIDESRYGRFLFLLNNKAVRDYIRYIINEIDTSNYPSFFRMAFRYLIYKEKISLKDMKAIINNYAILFTSICYYADEDNLFMDMINKGITAELLADMICDEETINELKASKAGKKIFEKTNPFFSKDYKTEEYYSFIDNRSQPFDLMVTKIIQERKEPLHFVFSLDKKENGYEDICKNITGKDYGPNTDLTAFIINAINPENPKYDNIRLEPVIHYQILSMNSGNKMSLKRINFIEETEDNIYRINLNDVSPFKFYYNNIHYIFDNNGIRAL